MPIIDIYRPQQDEDDVPYIFFKKTNELTVGKAIEISDDLFNELEMFNTYRIELQKVLGNLLKAE